MVSSALSRRLRLMAPALAVGVIAAGVALPRLADASDASAELAPLSASELLAAVSESEVDGLSGTVVATSRSGLPELPDNDGGGASALSLPGLLSGSTTARVWKAGDDRSRIAVDAPFAAYEVVRNGEDVHTYDSASSEVTHLVLPADEPEPTAPALPDGAATPQDVAEALLSAADETTEVSVGRASRVADRAAYELVLDPRDPATLVDSVRIAVDGEKLTPLRVQVFAVGQSEPAVEVGFTSVRFGKPDPSVFAFTPPPGAEVTEKSLEGTPHHDAERPAAPAGGRPQVLGEGWTTVVALPAVELPEQAAALVGQLARPVEGGQVITGALVSVLLLDDGRVLAGAVTPERLQQLAAR